MSAFDAVLTSPRSASRSAGFAYIGLFVLGIFANFFVLQSMIEPGDAAATTANIVANEGLFRLGIVAFLVIFALDVFVAWWLHILFKPVSGLSLLAAWFRLTYTVFLGVAAVFLGIGLKLATSGRVDVADSVMLNLDAFNIAWVIGLSLFGLHLVVLGRMMMSSVEMPNWLGLILVVAGAGYIFDTLANIGFSGYADHANVFLAIVAVPSIVAEFAFTLWLLLKGGKARAVGTEAAPSAAVLP